MSDYLGLDLEECRGSPLGLPCSNFISVSASGFLFVSVLSDYANLKKVKIAKVKILTSAATHWLPAAILQFMCCKPATSEQVDYFWAVCYSYYSIDQYSSIVQGA